MNLKLFLQKINISLFFKIIKNEFFILSLFVLLIIYPIFFIKGSIFLSDYVYGYCLNNKFFEGIAYYNFNIINFINNIISYIFGCELSIRIFIFVALFVFVYSFYKVSLLFTKNKLLSFVVAFFSLMTPFVYDRIGIGQIPLILSCGLLILSIYFILKLLTNKEELNNKFKQNILLMFVFYSLSFLASSQFIFIFILFLPLVFYIVYLEKLEIKKIILYSFLFLFLFSFINFNFLFGSNNSIYNAYVSNIKINNIGNLLPVGDNFYEILYNSLNSSNHFTEKKSFRYLSLVYEYPKALSFLSFFIFFSLFVYGIYLVIKKEDLINKKIYYYLLFTFLLSVVLSFGVSNTIFFNFNRFLFDNVPFYKAMRDSTKWSLVTILIYVIFISKALFYLNINKSKNIKNIILILFIISSIFRAPYLFFGLYGQMSDYIKPINNDLYVVRNYFLKNNPNGKILILPWAEYIYPKFLEVATGKRYSIMNVFSYFFPYDVYDYSSINKFSDSFVEDKVKLINQINLEDDNFVQYIKSIDFKYIIYIKTNFIPPGNSSFDKLNKNINLESVLDYDNVSIFKILD